jgi:hypothetical protein
LKSVWKKENKKWPSLLPFRSVNAAEEDSLL